MNKQLFRNKSIQKVSSPEQLDAYVRVATPGIWMLLAAIVVLLIGVCVWGVLGHLDTTLSTVAVSKDNQTTVYVKAENVREVETGMKVILDAQEFTVATISQEPKAVDETFSEYACHVGNLQQGEWVYVITVNGAVAEGIYDAQIVTESVSPISFVIN